MVKTVEGGSYGDMHRKKVCEERTKGKGEVRGTAWRERVARATVRSKLSCQNWLNKPRAWHGSRAVRVTNFLPLNQSLDVFPSFLFDKNKALGSATKTKKGERKNPSDVKWTSQIHHRKENAGIIRRDGRAV